MKKLLLLTLLSIPFLSFSQDQTNKWGFSATSGVVGYKGDYGSRIFSPSVENFGSGIIVSRFLNQNFDIDFNLLTGNHHSNFTASILSFGSNLKYKFGNSESKFKPYAKAGVLLSAFSSSKKLATASANQDLNIPLSLGVDYVFSHKIKLGILSSANFLVADEFDTKVAGGSDITFYNGLVLTYIPGEKDSDGDGVIDPEDNCIDVPGEMCTKGCPDTDKDGVADKDDKCPNLAGSVYGCPDSDGDGINDDMDKCPDLAGVVYGCPDSDGDGFADKEDACPDVAGKLNGCPDSDGDGITDAEDACPNEFGSPLANGCPDSDGDGVIDTEDECPEAFGNIENKGCPKFASNTTAFSDDGNVETILHVFFETNSSSIASEYYEELDKLITIMKKDGQLRMVIEGHTDATGGDNLNKVLSENRMKGMLNYLESKKINPNRIMSKSFGEDFPLLPNTTRAGREMNRRVTVKVISNFK